MIRRFCVSGGGLLHCFVFCIVALVSFPLDGRAEVGVAGGHDASQPIKIASDSLEVQREDQVAIFRGNVDAAQGDMNLHADTLIVRYDTNSGGDQEISHIEAEGNVFLSSPSETVSGDEGIYNVTDGTIELYGSIVLTRGENVIRGDRLELNLKTGHSRVISEASGSSGGRVKGLFIPKSDDGPKNPDSPPADVAP